MARKRRKRRWVRRRNRTAQPDEVLGDDNAGALALARQIVIGRAADKAADVLENRFEAEHSAGRIAPAGKGNGEVMGNGTGENGTAAKPPPAGRSVLNRAQERKLEDWLSSQWDRIAGERPTVKVAAEQATAALGFTVSPGNVRGAVKTIEKDWPIPACRNAGGAGTRKRQIRTLTAQLVALLDSWDTEMASADFRKMCAELEITEPLPPGAGPRQ